MICPNCGSECPEQAASCPICDTIVPESLPEMPVKQKKALWKRIPYIIMVVLLLLGSVLFALTAQPPQYDTPNAVTDPAYPWFSMVNGAIRFNPSLYEGGETLEIPSTLGGEKVTAIAPDGFSWTEGITEIRLPNTIVSIGDYAFSFCPDLRGIFVPASVTSIGEGAFMGCTALESICVSYSVKSIGAGALENCPKLIHIFYPGPISSWRELYTEKIAENTHIYAADGDFLHSEG